MMMVTGKLPVGLGTSKALRPCVNLIWRQEEGARPGGVSFEQGVCRTLRVRSRKGREDALLTTLATYGVITSNLARSLETTAAKPQVAREADYYLANVGNVKSIDDFLADDRIFAFAMKAFGLGEVTYAKAFMRKVLAEGVDKSDSFANSLSDRRYREFAEAFNFVRYGDTATVFERTRQGTVDRYVRQTLEEDAGAQNEGVRLALYFERKASSIQSAYGILADAALLKVVQTALGLAAATSSADIDRQAEMITARLDLDDLKDPDKVERLLTRFATLWELGNAPALPTSTAASVLFAQPLEAGIGADLLASLQNLRLGGG
jgi:hypothetical protein